MLLTLLRVGDLLLTLAGAFACVTMRAPTAELVSDEDVLAMAGAGSLSPTESSVLQRVGARMPYLMFTLVGGIGVFLIRSHPPWILTSSRSD